MTAIPTTTSEKGGGREPSTFPIDRVNDNRLNGLLRELAEAIAEEENPALLRTIGQSLKMIGDRARNKAYSKTGSFW